MESNKIDRLMTEDELQAVIIELANIKNNPTDVLVEGVGLLTKEQHEAYTKSLQHDDISQW